MSLKILVPKQSSLDVKDMKIEVWKVAERDLANRFWFGWHFELLLPPTSNVDKAWPSEVLKSIYKSSAFTECV